MFTRESRHFSKQIRLKIYAASHRFIFQEIKKYVVFLCTHMILDFSLFLFWVMRNGRFIGGMCFFFGLIEGLLGGGGKHLSLCFLPLVNSEPYFGCPSLGYFPILPHWNCIKSNDEIG
jgi:hypothetical protein